MRKAMLYIHGKGGSAEEADKIPAQSRKYDIMTGRGDKHGQRERIL